MQMQYNFLLLMPLLIILNNFLLYYDKVILCHFILTEDTVASDYVIFPLNNGILKYFFQLIYS